MCYSCIKNLEEVVMAIKSVLGVFNTPMSKMTIGDNVVLEKTLAKRSDRFRKGLVIRGLSDKTGDVDKFITADFITGEHPHRFDEQGNLTETGKKWANLSVIAAKIKGKRPQDVTIGEYILAFLKRGK